MVELKKKNYLPINPLVTSLSAPVSLVKAFYLPNISKSLSLS